MLQLRPATRDVTCALLQPDLGVVRDRHARLGHALSTRADQHVARQHSGCRLTSGAEQTAACQNDVQALLHGHVSKGTSSPALESKLHACFQSKFTVISIT